MTTGRCQTARCKQSGGLTMDFRKTGMPGDLVPDERLLTPAEVASLFGVDPRTVTRWAAAGRLAPVRTPGGHRRYRRSEVFELRDKLMGN